MVENCLNTYCPDFSTTTKNEVEKIRAFHSNWLYEDIKEVVEDVELAARQG